MMLMQKSDSGKNTVFIFLTQVIITWAMLVSFTLFSFQKIQREGQNINWVIKQTSRKSSKKNRNMRKTKQTREKKCHFKGFCRFFRKRIPLCITDIEEKLCSIEEKTALRRFVSRLVLDQKIITSRSFVHIGQEFGGDERNRYSWDSKWQRITSAWSADVMWWAFLKWFSDLWVRIA